jgi:hypothetical protein
MSKFKQNEKVLVKQKKGYVKDYSVYTISYIDSPYVVLSYYAYSTNFYGIEDLIKITKLNKLLYGI